MFLLQPTPLRRAHRVLLPNGAGKAVAGCKKRLIQAENVLISNRLIGLLNLGNQWTGGRTHKRLGFSYRVLAANAMALVPGLTGMDTRSGWHRTRATHAGL